MTDPVGDRLNGDQIRIERNSADVNLGVLHGWSWSVMHANRLFFKDDSPRQWLAPPQGLVRFSADRIEISQGETENTITAIGSIVIQSIGNQDSVEFSQLTLTAERAVIFTDPMPLDKLAAEVDAEAVRGVYLEGNVTASAERGEYVIRTPQAYYDFRTQRAIMPNALLGVHPRTIGIPIHARAKEMRQVAENQWETRDVTVSTSEFFTPHLAIGADRMTITERTSSAGETATHFESRDNTVEIGGIPIFYWPRFSGSIESMPLKSLEVGSRSNDGMRFLTTWDLFALAGKEAPPGVQADLKVDGFTKRGAALGLDLRYDVGDSYGRVDLYGLYDEGIDRTSSGGDVQPANELRGVALLEHQTQLNEDWLFQAQTSLIGDETFISAWREDDYVNRREFETSLYLKHQRESAALTILGKYALNDFISNDFLLASRQYTVDKAPELTYRRYGDSLFNDLFTYSMENRLTRMRLAFHQTTPRQIGVGGQAFGIGDDVPIDDPLFAAGLRQKWVNRYDTRHELALPLHFGSLNLMPFVVGRLTGYDDDFAEFSSDSDELRYFGAAGVRANLQFQRIDNSAENQLLDIHRLRHLFEPYVTFWSADSSIDQDDLPVYDEEVESLAAGTAIQFGLRNVWQTQRGGPGRWRSVDVFTLDASLVLDSEGQPGESPAPQFFDYRPEYSQFGDHLRGSGAWLLSDNLSLVGEATYALEDSVLARGSIGAELRHSPLLTTYVEYRYLDAGQTELLAVGWNYQLTPKYRISVVPQYDFRQEDFRSLDAWLTRSFPDFNLSFRIKYDQIRDDTTFGATLNLVEF